MATDLGWSSTRASGRRSATRWVSRTPTRRRSTGCLRRRAVTHPSIPGLPCVVQPGALLTAARLPANLVVEFPPLGRRWRAGLLGNGDAAYPGYIGRSTASFEWSGFESRPVGPNGTQTSPSLPADGSLCGDAPAAGDAADGGGW